MMMVAAMMMMTGVVNASNANSYVGDDAANYSININMKSLSRALFLDDDQAIDMEIASKRLSRSIKKAEKQDGSKQNEIVTKAINRNLRAAHKALDAKQFHDYVTIMNITLNNTGLSKNYNNGNVEK